MSDVVNPGSRCNTPELAAALNGHEGMLEMINLISDLQSDRMNSQRAELRPLQPEDTRGASLPGQNASATIRIKPEEDFLEIIARVQGSRLEDQRTELPRLQPEAAPVQAAGPAPTPGPQAAAQEPAPAPAKRDDDDDAFFAQLMRAQSSRLEDQRATIGGAPKKN